MKRTRKQIPPLNTTEALHTCSHDPPFDRPVLWHCMDLSYRPLKGRGHSQARTEGCCLRRYLFCTGKKHAIVCTGTHRRDSPPGQPIRGCSCRCHFAQGRNCANNELLPLMFFYPIFYLGFIQSESLRIIKKTL